MAKTETETKTKTATRSANARTKKAPADGVEKKKREPSAYNLFVSANMKQWINDNPGRPRPEAMKAVAAMWADAPENPKRGQPVVKRAPKEKAPKKAKETKAKPKPKKKKADSEEEEDVEEDEDEEDAKEEDDEE
ncbi:unnamed protein product [Mycena citricolor]|uniref:YABBY protein C-terminal domain-containing protein n=1 Tax=Mycena citricolor TaxID=2018698 RepID=A0AAD2HPU8_9AGAR|nr:unnamed protein product [Mycena citricolor]